MVAEAKKALLHLNPLFLIIAQSGMPQVVYIKGSNVPYLESERSL